MKIKKWIQSTDPKKMAEIWSPLMIIYFLFIVYIICTLYNCDFRIILNQIKYSNNDNLHTLFTQGLPEKKL